MKNSYHGKHKTIGRRRGRVLAFQALYAWDTARLSPMDIARFSWSESYNGPDSEDIFLFPRLLFLGTLEHIDEIDVKIAAHLNNWAFERISRVDKAILRLSTYSLLFQSDVPISIVINEAVNIAHEYGTDDSFRFVNAVLDSRKKECLDYSYEKAGC